MENLEFNFNEGKERIVNMLTFHAKEFEKDMIYDVQIVINRDEEDVLESIEDIIETARRNRNAVEKAIIKVQDSSSIQEILKAVKDTCFEEDEENILCKLFGLNNLTIK